jgi:inositol transporter-like SP family MFS transporter
MCILLLGMLFAPGNEGENNGLLYGWVKAAADLFAGSEASLAQVNVFASRLVFFSLFVVAFVAWNLQRKLQESAEFETAKAKSGKVSLWSNIRLLFGNRVAVRTVAYLAVIYLSWNLVASVMGFFQPHIYESAGGLSNKDANMLSCISWAVVVFVTFIVSRLVDKFSHRIFYVLGLLCALTAWMIIIGIGVNNIVWLWVFTILWGINNGCSVQIFYALWGSELFPAKFRAGAQGLLFFIVRSLSAVWGLIFTYIYGNNGEGFTVAAYCMVALLLISLIVGFIGAPDTRGKSLEQITKQRYGENI